MCIHIGTEPLETMQIFYHIWGLSQFCGASPKGFKVPKALLLLHFEARQHQSSNLNTIL